MLFTQFYSMIKTKRPSEGRDWTDLNKNILKCNNSTPYKMPIQHIQQACQGCLTTETITVQFIYIGDWFRGHRSSLALK